MVKPELLKLEIPSSHEFIGTARKAVEEIAARTPLTGQDVEDLKLAVGEACTNAVKFSKLNQKTFGLLFRLETDRLEVEVSNNGEAFPIEFICPTKPCIEDLPEGGLGLYLIDQVMDELNISSADGETVVKMVKRFKS